MTSMIKVPTTSAPTIFRNLNGLICLHKPSGKSVKSVRTDVLNIICKELNEMDCRPCQPYVKIEGDTSKKLDVKVVPSFADNPLVIGPRYVSDEIYCSTGNFLGARTSGVLVFGLNSGSKQIKVLRNAHLLRTYLLKGKLGEFTDNLFSDGKVMLKGRFDFITRGALDKVTSVLQAVYQKNMFHSLGIDGQSQTAYELASKGLLRPYKTLMPLIYGIKCVDFTPPEFTIEIQCMNETEEYLLELIAIIGRKARTISTCTQIKCISFSCFNLDNALLQKHWTLQNFVDNMATCATNYNKITELVSPILVNLKEGERSPD